MSRQNSSVCLFVCMFVCHTFLSLKYCFNVSSVSTLFHQYFTCVSPEFHQCLFSVSPAQGTTAPGDNCTSAIESLRLSGDFQPRKTHLLGVLRPLKHYGAKHSGIHPWKLQGNERQAPCHTWWWEPNSELSHHDINNVWLISLRPPTSPADLT